MVGRALGRARRDRGRAHGRHVRHRERRRRIGLRLELSSSATASPPWNHQRSDETLLIGDTAAKVRQLALAKVPGGTIVRVETDADGNAAYEAHMVKADGSVESRMPGSPCQAPAPAASSSSSGSSA